MYHLIILRIRGMQISEIIATYAIGLAIIEGLRWGGLRGSTFTLPSFLAGSVGIGGISVDYQRLFVLGSGVVVFAALGLFVKFTKTGLALKAIAQDEGAAMMLGIDSDRKALVSFALGSGLSAFAAILILPLGSIVVETGYNVLIYSIAVSIIGGLGSWGGAIVASFIIGFAQILTEVFLSTQYQMVISLLAIIVTLLLKPSGIFGKQKELDELAVVRDRETAKIYGANPAYASFLVNKELASKVQIAVLPLGTDSGVLGNIIQGAIGSGKK